MVPENSTLAFPCDVKVVNEPVTLSDLTLSASVEIDVGKTVVITRFHPVSEVYAVARQGDSDTFWLRFIWIIQPSWKNLPKNM